MGDGVYTEGVVKDGASILYDGFPVPVEEVVGELNYLLRRVRDIDRIESRLGKGWVRTLADSLEKAEDDD